MYSRYCEVGEDLKKSEMTVQEIAHIAGEQATERSVRNALGRGIKWNITQKWADEHSPGQQRHWSLTKSGINYCKKLELFYDYETDTVIKSLKDKVM